MYVCGNGWSKSIFLEEMVVLKFDFNHGAKKSGHLDRHLWTNIFHIFRYILRETGLLWFTTSKIRKNIINNDRHRNIPGLWTEWDWTSEPPQKMFLSENVIFRGLRLSLGHFGQQAPESPVSQLQNGVSTSSLPPFIVYLLTFKEYPRSNSFSSMGILEGVKWQTSQAGT